MKILITGCHGQLGTELQKQLADEECALGPLPERLRKATVIAVDVDELDITDREATVTYIRRTQPDTVINCAAFTNVDGCETNRDAAYRVNALGPRNLALACEKINARLIHISTDYVFPGTANGGVALDESALPAPISAYGQTKLLGETYVQQFCRRHFIVRTAWLYSYYGKNFVKTMVNLAKTHDTLNEMYLQEGKLDVQLLGRGYAWLDTGTMDSLVEAADFVRMIEQRQGIKISAPEEIAYKYGWINRGKLLESAERYGKSPYGQHLRNVADDRLKY